MPTPKALFPVALVVLAAGVWYLWSHEGQAHGVTLDERAWGASYDPWAHYRTRCASSFSRAYPKRVGANCLPEPFAAEDGAVSTRGGGLYGC